MDKMELALKLQEAQLIKDSKLFEELSRCIDETLSSLQTAISYGNDVVNQKPKVRFLMILRNGMKGFQRDLKI